MKVYVINLERNRERFVAVAARIKQLGVDFVRVSAVDGKLLSMQDKKSAVNRFRLWCAQGRRLRDGEIGCAMSHYSIYRKMRKEVVCILEDDVLLADNFSEILAKVESWIDPKRRQVVLLSNHSREVGQGIVRSSGDMYTEGYVITASAAKALLAANWPMQVPCDHWRRWVKRGDIELYHAFPSACSQDQSRYVSNTTGEGGANYPIWRWALHKAKRLLGKFVDELLLIYEAHRRVDDMFQSGASDLALFGIVVSTGIAGWI